MQTTRGVYLFDEFDVVGTSRTATDDVGEARRVVNSFLQLLEHDDSESIVIAATNRPEAIDVAMFRRFDDLLVFSPPDADAIRRLVEGRLAPFQSVNLQWAAIRKAAIGLSHAEIVKGCEDAAKRTVLAHQRAITTRNLIEAFNARKRPTPRRASTSQTPKRRRGK
jgi:SpoVK/Ycf46/Vps4 family AAA+-type ATPase